MDFGILGPLLVSQNGREVPIGAAKQRALLTLLLLRRGEVVPTETLIDELWGEHPPATAVKAVQVYVSQLRKALGEGLLETRPGGYMLRLEPGALDAARFEGLLTRGRDLLADRDEREAGEVLRDALGLWRGPPLAEFRYDDFARDEIGRLEELRLVALEHRLEVDLALGRHAEAVPELEALVREHPLRESLRSLLMIALYRAGRQADALEAYQDARTALVEKLGLDPSESLHQLETAILRHDPTLDLPRARSDRAHRHRSQPPAVGGGSSLGRRSVFALAAAAALVVAGIAAFLLTERQQLACRARQRRLGRLHRRARRRREQPGPGRPGSHRGRDRRRCRLGGQFFGRDSLARRPADPDRAPDDHSRGEPERDRRGRRRRLGCEPRRPHGLVDQPAVEQRRRPDRGRSRPQRGRLRFRVGLGRECRRPHRLTRINPGSGKVTATIPTGTVGRGITVGGGSVWVTDEATRSVVQIDPATNSVASKATVGTGPTGIAYGDGSVWVANALDGTVSRIDATTLVVRATIPVPGGPSAVSFGNGSVWVSAEFGSRVVRIDPRRDVVIGSTPIGNRPEGLAAGDGGVWVAVQASGRGHRGGRLVITGGSIDTIDPASPDLTTSVLVMNAVYDGLTAFRRAGGSAGTQLVPDLAAALPLPTDGGRSYTFHVRRGIRYSDGRPLRAEDFRRALERDFFVGAVQTQQGQLRNLVGAAGCVHHRRCDLSSVSVRGPLTLTFRLTAPDPRFLRELTTLVPVPAGTPLRDVGTKPIPSTGAYAIESYVAGPTAHARPQPPLPRLVCRRAPRWLSGRDRLPRREQGHLHPRCAHGQGGPHAGLAENERFGSGGTVSAPGARRAGAGDGVRVPERPSRAVRRHPRPSRAQLRRRPEADGGVVRRCAAGAADLPDRSFDRARVQAVLPVHDRP